MALYLLSQFLPLTLLFLVVVVLDIRVTSAPANTFIFFAQVIPNVFTLNGGGAIPRPHAASYVVKVYTFLYDIWNLQFFKEEICVSPNLSTLYRSHFLDIPRSCLPTITVSLFIWLYERGLGCILFVFRPFHILLARFNGTAIYAAPSFTPLLLSFSSLTVGSF